jgi:SAM-dependent methyltransferase
VDAGAWDKRYAESGLLWSTTPNQFVESELAGLRPGRALDLACGEGRNALWLADRGWQVTAVDFSGVALDKGRALEARAAGADDPPISWVQADALSFEAGGAPFDLVVLAYLQLAAEERRAAVRRAFLALRPGGTFFLIAHDATNLTEGTGGPTDASVLFTAEEVLADLDGERFEVQRAERVERVVPAPDGTHRNRGDETRTAYDALVRVLKA